MNLEAPPTATDSVEAPKAEAPIAEAAAAAPSLWSRLKRGASYFWRTDPLFPLAVSGVILTVLSARKLVSPLNQTFADFKAANSRPLLWMGVGLLLFLLGALRSPDAIRMKSTAILQIRKPRSRKRGIWYLAFLTGGIVLIGLAVWCYTIMIRRILKFPVGLDQPAMLLAALALAVAGMAMLERGRLRGWFRDLGFFRRSQSDLPFYKRDLPYLLFFLLAWFGLMIWRLESRPGFFHGDEAVVVQYGRSTYFFDEATKNMSAWHTQYAPYLAGVPRSLMKDLFSWSPYFGPRLCTLLISTMALGLIFVLARTYVGRMAAWFALILAATHHVIMAFSRMGILSMDAIFLNAAAILAWTSAWRSRRASHALLAGVLAGLGYYTYHGALLIFPLLAVVIGMEFIRSPKGVLGRWLLLAMFVIGTVSAAAPIHVYYRSSPDNIAGRTSQVSVLSRANLEAEMKATNSTSLPDFFIKRSWPALGGILMWPDTSSNYRYMGLPIFDRDTTALFLLSVVASILFIRQRRFVEMLLMWAILGLVLGSLFTTAPPPPYVPRVMMAFPAIFILGGWVISNLVHRAYGLGGRRLGGPVLVGLGVWTGSIAWRNVDHFEFKYLNDMSNPGYTLTPTGMMRFMEHFPPDAEFIYFCGHFHQLYTSCLAMFDTAFPRRLIVEPNAPIPEPASNVRRTAYVFKIPEFAETEQRFLARFPGATPKEIFYEYLQAPASHHVYWIEQSLTEPPHPVAAP